jgi:hypothetical protein
LKVVARAAKIVAASVVAVILERTKVACEEKTLLQLVEVFPVRAAEV